MDSADKIPLLRDDPAVHPAGQHTLDHLIRKLRLIRSGAAKPSVQRRQLRIGGVGGVNVPDMAGVIECPIAGRIPDANDRVLIRGIGGKLRFIGFRVYAAHAAATKDVFVHMRKKRAFG